MLKEAAGSSSGSRSFPKLICEGGAALRRQVMSRPLTRLGVHDLDFHVSDINTVLPDDDDGCFCAAPRGTPPSLGSGDDVFA